MATDIDPARRRPTEEELAAWAAEVRRGLPKLPPEALKAIADIYDQIDRDAQETTEEAA